MAERTAGIGIPQQSIVYTLLCLTGILLFLFGGIVPNISEMSTLDRQEARVKFQIWEQQALTPLYHSFQSKGGKRISESLPLPARGKLALDKIDTLPATLRTAAKMSGMTLESAVPNLSALTGDAQALAVSAVLRGEFASFRKFLINLGAVPYLHHIEEVSIEQKPDAREFRLKIWVAVG